MEMQRIYLIYFMQALVARLIRALVFHRIAILNRSFLPTKGPVLYLGLHRNGAVDAFVYRLVAPDAVPLVSKQLTRNWLGRLLFDGIEVVRTVDVKRYGMSTEHNEAAIDRCISHLKNGGKLFILPEGTSDLGPRHLPFHSGAARILLSTLSSGTKITVVPLGIHYERGWAFRSNVEIVVGEPFYPAILDYSPDKRRLEILTQTITRSLEKVGINVTDSKTQSRLEQTAYIACINPNISYFQALKAFEEKLPTSVNDAWCAIDMFMDKHHVATHFGVPVAPLTTISRYLAIWLIFTPIVSLAVISNFIPLVGGYFAGRQLADAPNVITFWRTLVGVPLAVVYWIAKVFLCLVIGFTKWLLLFIFITLAGLVLYRKSQQVTAVLVNAMFYRGLTSRFRRLYKAIQESINNG